MASISQGIIVTAVILVSSTVLYFAYSYNNKCSPSSFQIPRDHSSNNPTKQFLRSCLYSGEKKKNKKKRVKFAENVMVKEISEENKEEEQKKKQNSRIRNCINETKEMPANRIALYNGIMRDRGNRIARCH
ncbi:hypothetical protein HN51_053340 [Arachis hypogaea]|uniref:Transmembrane protein n=1 Tax=Arachis hypogaea TaxID=3818 RepID=A0A444XC83_ARAHY|nr:uncharacterized protein LOC110266651 [Arachis ipaensis]XP_025679439.1 uncharacterized protein LOC112779410 [Arachis hypogaea]QHN75668.1 uncharacterized protein DS421_19g637260 [Arachis hypogaea]RYQ87237.1 hypothetical protein Ahy_B09g094714 [Arachis hypogaea]